MKCNYNCGYCTLLDNEIKDGSKDKLLRFQKNLNNLYPEVELFLFGGEPFLHPYIEFILQNFIDMGQPFIVQTNFSKKSVEVMNRLKLTKPININISIHQTETDLNILKKDFSSIRDNINIKQIDVMYLGRESVGFTLKLKRYLNQRVKYEGLSLIPVGDFEVDGYSEILKEYNIIKNSAYRKVIDFEGMKRINPFNGIMEYRADIWEDMFVNNKSTMGLPCMYQGVYFLYSANLELYNCCYRKKNNGICEQQNCFMM